MWRNHSDPFVSPIFSCNIESPLTERYIHHRILYSILPCTTYTLHIYLYFLHRSIELDIEDFWLSPSFILLFSPFLLYLPSVSCRTRDSSHLYRTLTSLTAAVHLARPLRDFPSLSLYSRRWAGWAIVDPKDSLNLLLWFDPAASSFCDSFSCPFFPRPIASVDPRQPRPKCSYFNNIFYYKKDLWEKFVSYRIYVARRSTNLYWHNELTGAVCPGGLVGASVRDWGLQRNVQRRVVSVIIFDPLLIISNGVHVTR